MALLEAIDTRINSKFLDNYVGVPFDLSKVFFICSVRSYEDIPEQFIPRFEILELPGYITSEKIVITKRYIIPKLLKKHILAMAELGPDAFIVATPGVLKLCHELVPDMPLHLSTQANVMNVLDAQVYVDKYNPNMYLFEPQRVMARHLRVWQASHLNLR